MMSVRIVAGSSLLVLLVVDVLLTVFPPLGHGGPLHRRLNHLFWAPYRFLAIRWPRSPLVAWAGPTIAALSLGVWVVCLVGGFALVYSGLHGLAATSSTSAPDWVVQLYYSGYVATTLGLGDVVPTLPSVRILTILEGTAGLFLFAVATTYGLGVSQAVDRAHQLALEIHLFHPDRGARESGTGAAVADRLEWSRSLLRSALDHRHYPLIQFFRPLDSRRDLVAQLPRLLSALSTDDGTPSNRGRADLEAALNVYLVEVNAACIPGWFRPPPTSIEETSSATLLARLCLYLGGRPRDLVEGASK